MYNTYQNRVAVARESYNRAILNFNNSITQARLQNNSALAEIAYQALQQQLELSLQGFQYKNQLLLEQANKKTELEQMYHERWQDVLDQMNTENALAEEVRQFNEQMEWEKYVYEQAHASSGGGGGGGSSSSRTGGNDVKQIKQDEKTTDELANMSASDIIANNRKVSQTNMLNTAIAGGADRDAVANAIANAEKNGTITKSEATELRKTYTPANGLRY